MSSDLLLARALFRRWSLDFEVEASEWSMRNLNAVMVWFDRLDFKRQETVANALQQRSNQLKAKGLPVRECLKVAVMELHCAVFESKN